MRVVVIDDEPLALEYLEKRLLEQGGIAIVGKYTDPFSGRDAVARGGVDAVFLDIHLPEVNGMELAEQLLAEQPALNIVFVSAHDDFAVQAFELDALDYVVKPVGAQRLAKTLERIRFRLEQTQVHEQERADERLQGEEGLQVQLLGQMRIAERSGALAAVQWRTARAREMFLYLLQHRGQLIRKSEFIELLWPDYDLGKVYAQLYTTVYHIRKTLERYGDHFELSSTSDAYTLNIHRVQFDTEQMERKLTDKVPLTPARAEQYAAVLQQCREHYLQEHTYWWAEHERERLSGVWLEAAMRLAEWLEENGRADLAGEWYRQVCARQPHEERAHYALMRLHDATGSRLAVHQQYRALCTALEEGLGEQPSRYISDWYDNWRSRGAANAEE
ncbi:response regulator [Paenibacillus sp. IB182496]|uniref:Response regulator n=1 Tax=Paenibacillus sabuli TaxID=2772509 RepID=A0A927BP28_9BACL|nr:response regulator [Paenibacillus sabuli]MBD2844106.1 response regulator [Paenibacillus sabuli]